MRPTLTDDDDNNNVQRGWRGSARDDTEAATTFHPSSLAAGGRLMINDHGHLEHLLSGATWVHWGDEQDGDLAETRTLWQGENVSSEVGSFSVAQK